MVSACGCVNVCLCVGENADVCCGEGAVCMSHRDKTRVRVFQCFDFISFPHLNMQIMGPNNTKN